MNNILDLMKTPKDVNNDIVKRMRARRKEQKLTQAELSRRAGVSLGSLYSSIQEVIDGQR